MNVLTSSMCEFLVVVWRLQCCNVRVIINYNGNLPQRLPENINISVGVFLISRFLL